MSNISGYKSRVGKLSCNPEEIFNFVTDIRNFHRFAPSGAIVDWIAEKESCRFEVPSIGNVNFKVTEKEQFKKIIFSGNALQNTSFSIVLNITENSEDLAEVIIDLQAELNPFLKMMAEKPIVKFLETLINEMEKFRGWKEIKA